jgi:secreted trypsin-like serine protease
MGLHECGGTVVAPDVILSAAHCAPYVSRVVVGLYDLSDSTEIVEAFTIIDFRVHQKYQEDTQRFDFALFRINGNVEGTFPVKINNDPNTPVLSESLTAVGWGAISTVGEYGEYPDIFQEVDLLYIDNESCDNILRSESGYRVFGDMLCAGDHEKDACWGDSGGPLFRVGNDTSDTLQVGVTSWGLGCGSGIPGVYQRTSYSFPWIRKTLCQLSLSPPDYLLCNTEAPTSAPTSLSGAPTPTPGGLAGAPGNVPSDLTEAPTNATRDSTKASTNATNSSSAQEIAASSSSTPSMMTFLRTGMAALAICVWLI